MNRTKLGHFLYDWLRENTNLTVGRVQGEVIAYDGEETIFSVSKLADDIVRAWTEEED